MVKQSRLEDLPDEILIEICLFLSPFDILYSFGRLNRRLQRTITEFGSQFDLTFFPLDSFQYFCSVSFLNFISERLTKLILSNEWVFGQIELFEKAIEHICFKEKFPMLKSMSLRDFTNNNVTILPKLLFLEELSIKLSSRENINSTTECLINSYVFNEQNNFRKVKLNNNQGVQLKPQTQSNTLLKELSIQIATLEDLTVLFTLIPCVIQLEVTIMRAAPSTFIFQDQFSIGMTPKSLKELYLYTMDNKIMPFETLYLMILSIPSLEYITFDIKTNDPYYAEPILWTNLITSIPCLTTLNLSLKIRLTEALFNRFGAETNLDLKQKVFDTFNENINLFSFITYINTQTLFIDSIPYRFSRYQSCDTSPEAMHALCNDSIAIQQSPRRVAGLSLNGEHVPITMKDYLNIIHRFPHINWIYLKSINVNDEKKEEDELLPINLKLKYFKQLCYYRSNLCKVNRAFFNQLFYGHEQLDTLKMFYGDLKYLLRTALPPIMGNHIKHLGLYCNGADGVIRLIDLDYFILAFPLLEHLIIKLTSHNLIKKNQTEIIETLIRSFKQLRSFLIVCEKGTLQLARTLMEDEQLKLHWLARINVIGAHLTLSPKSLALWKSDNHITYC